jgi:hypothetical protein
MEKQLDFGAILHKSCKNYACPPLAWTKSHKKKHKPE